MRTYAYLDASLNLELGALLRRSPSFQDDALAADERRRLLNASLRHPPGAGLGEGATIGRHSFFCDRQNQWLWLNGERLISLRDANIVLLVETGESVAIAGMDRIDGDIGAASSYIARGSVEDVSRQTKHFHERLREVIARSRAARDFLGS